MVDGITNVSDNFDHDGISGRAKNQDKAQSKPSLFMIEDDKAGTLGHGTFETDDIKGVRNVWTECALIDRLGMFLGKNWSEVETDVKAVLNSFEAQADALLNSVDTTTLKDEDGNINGQNLATTLKSIENLAKEKNIQSEISNTAIIKIINNCFGVEQNNSMDYGAQQIYFLQDGSRIVYTRNRSLSVETPDGKVQSYNMDGEKLEEVPKNDAYALEYYLKKNTDAYLKRSKEIEENTKRQNDVISQCPFLSENKKDGFSNQGAVKDARKGDPMYKFTDSTGQQVGPSLNIYDTSDVKFNEKNQLIEFVEFPNTISETTYSFEYDDSGNLISYTEKETKRSNGQEYSASFQYDDQNRMIKETKSWY